MRRVGVLVAAAVLAAAAVTGSSAAVRARTSVFTGYGFDTCSAPALASMQAWSVSPYRAIGIYIGGANRACADGNLSSSWVTSVITMGWSVMPLYVGLQAPCVSQAKLTHIAAATANAQGVQAADDAVVKAETFGLLAGSPVYFDMEGYNANDPACTGTVQAFLTGWVAELHTQGYVAGVYGSAASTIRDMASIVPQPDDAWIANWNGKASVFGDPYVSDSLWTNDQRIHQYKGGHKETWGGVTIGIDSNYVDAAVVGSALGPPPPPPPAAGSVGSGDSNATASWPAGAFASTAVVTLTPATPTAAPAGFGSGGYGVQLTVDDASTTPPTPVARFSLPVTVHIVAQPPGEVPAVSVDGGVTWKVLPKLPSTALPVGVDAGYATEPDGSTDVLTLVPGLFGLLPDVTPPGQPAGVSARLVNGALTLTWGPAPDASPIASYQVLLDGQPFVTKSGSVRRAVLRAFHPVGLTVYRVRAVDFAGNVGLSSRPFVVVPKARPANLPPPVPQWAWALSTWQHTHAGPRPAAAPKRPPAWFWTWSAWRGAPFRLKTP